MDGTNLFKKISPIYKEIKASKRLTKKRIAKSLSNFTDQSKNPSKLLKKTFKNG